jgi:hypothetical protein
MKSLIRLQTGLSRRTFLGGCGACAAGFAGVSGTNSGVRAAAATLLDLLPKTKTKVRLVFSYTPSDQPIWPNIGYNFDKRKDEILKQLAVGCPEIEFRPAVAHNVADAKRILEGDAEVAGYLVYLLGLGWADVPETVASSGRPTIYVDNLYGGSGKFLIAYAKARRNMRQATDGLKTWRVAGVSSRDPKDVADAANCLVCMEKLRQSTVLLIGRSPGPEVESIQTAFGTKIVPLDFAPLNALYQAADKDKARDWAERWIKEAERVIEPSREELQKSGAMYLAMTELMKQHQAQAITINCLGGFYGGKISAYPCLGFFQLNNDGLVGACEADLRSTLTMLAITYLTGRPGYISDPVIDTSTNQIIYAHCVAPNRVFGPGGPTNPYHIRSHSEDRKGACVRSLMPLNHMTSTLEFDAARRQVIFHQAKAVANVDEDMACRTKLAAEVKGDIDKLLGYWDQWGWHRVTVYGDIKRPIQNLAGLMGFQVIEEA